MDPKEFYSRITLTEKEDSIMNQKKVAGKITRKSMLYKTGVEYGDYCANFVQGCAHGCKYPCYAMLIAKRTGRAKTYEEWCKPYLVENTLDLLDKEIPKLKDKIECVELCFATDPFMYEYPEVQEMAYKVIKKLNDNDIKCMVITKGILPISLADLSKENVYGITLVSLDEDYREEYEPNAAPLADRLAALKALHDKGCKTMISCEPYPTPNIHEQDLGELLEAVSFVDRIIFGRAHYNKEISSYKEHKKFYNERAKEVVDFCTEHGIDYHIKAKTIS